MARGGREAGRRGAWRVARGVRHVARSRRNRRSAARVRRGGAKWGGEGRAVIRVNVRASRVCRRVMAHLDSSVLVNSRLHLLKEVVHLLEILLGAKVGHGREVVVLSEGVMGAGHTESVRRLGHVLSSQTTRVKTQRSMERHQSAANRLIGGRVNLTALDTTKEVIQVIKLALPSIEGSSLVASKIVTLATHGLGWVVHRGVVGLGCWVLSVVVTSLTILVGLAKGGLVSTAHMAIVIIETGGS